MARETNGMPGPRPGENSPSGVTRVLMTGYYDGAANGILQFGDGGPTFRFDMADDVGDNGHDILQPERTFTLRPMPADALDRFADAVAPPLVSRWPVWCPDWCFPTPDSQQQAEARTDAILAEAGPPEWTITTSDTVQFSRFRAEPVPVGQRA